MNHFECYAKARYTLTSYKGHTLGDLSFLEISSTSMNREDVVEKTMANQILFLYIQ